MGILISKEEMSHRVIMGSIKLVEGPATHLETHLILFDVPCVDFQGVGRGVEVH
jgi:hypothetical protein